MSAPAVDLTKRAEPSGRDFMGGGSSRDRRLVPRWLSTVAGVLLFLALFAMMGANLRRSSDGHIDRFGTVPLNGAEILTLPKATVDGSLTVDTGGVGTGSRSEIDLTPPDDLKITVTPASGHGPAVAQQAVHTSTDAGTTNHPYLPIVKLAIPAEGRYRVSVTGTDGVTDENTRVMFGSVFTLTSTFVADLPLLVVLLVVLIAAILLRNRMIVGPPRRETSAAPLATLLGGIVVIALYHQFVLVPTGDATRGFKGAPPVRAARQIAGHVTPKGTLLTAAGLGPALGALRTTVGAKTDIIAATLTARALQVTSAVKYTEHDYGVDATGTITVGPTRELVDNRQALYLSQITGGIGQRIAASAKAAGDGTVTSATLDMAIAKDTAGWKAQTTSGRTLTLNLDGSRR